jgi:hypothetical protein
VPPKRILFKADYESDVLLVRLKISVDWGLPNLIAIDCSAVHEEDTYVVLYKQDIATLPMITMNQGPYFEDPRPWQFNVQPRGSDALTLSNH